jgi:hypothetical protein
MFSCLYYNYRPEGFKTFSKKSFCPKSLPPNKLGTRARREPPKPLWGMGLLDTPIGNELDDKGEDGTAKGDAHGDPHEGEVVEVVVVVLHVLIIALTQGDTRIKHEKDFRPKCLISNKLGTRARREPPKPLGGQDLRAKTPILKPCLTVRLKSRVSVQTDNDRLSVVLGGRLLVASRRGNDSGLARLRRTWGNGDFHPQDVGLFVNGNFHFFLS